MRAKRFSSVREKSESMLVPRRDGQRGQKLNIGKRAAVFPLAHCLCAHVEGFCKLLRVMLLERRSVLILLPMSMFIKGKTPFL